MPGRRGRAPRSVRGDDRGRGACSADSALADDNEEKAQAVLDRWDVAHQDDPEPEGEGDGADGTAEADEEDAGVSPRRGWRGRRLTEARPTRTTSAATTPTSRSSSTRSPRGRSWVWALRGGARRRVPVPLQGGIGSIQRTFVAGSRRRWPLTWHRHAPPRRAPRVYRQVLDDTRRCLGHPRGAVLRVAGDAERGLDYRHRPLRQPRGEQVRRGHPRQPARVPLRRPDDNPLDRLRPLPFSRSRVRTCPSVVSCSSSSPSSDPVTMFLFHMGGIIPFRRCTSAGGRSSSLSSPSRQLSRPAASSRCFLGIPTALAYMLGPASSGCPLAAADDEPPKRTG